MSSTEISWRSGPILEQKIMRIFIISLLMMMIIFLLFLLLLIIVDMQRLVNKRFS